jgi:hypothetical protein
MLVKANTAIEGFSGSCGVAVPRPSADGWSGAADLGGLVA